MNYWVVDNTVISNFALIGNIKLLKEKLQEKMVIPEEVKKEFLSGIDKGVIPETDISWLKVVKRIGDEYILFNRFCLELGMGESACLSIAINRGCNIFTDDVDARITAQRFEVPVSGTIGVLIYLIHKKYITLEEGNRMLNSMINKGYYSPIRILDDLLDT